MQKKYIEDYWKHLKLVRLTTQGVSWASPLYVENSTAETKAVVPATLGRYIVIGCMSSDFVVALFEEPALREMIDGAIRKIPFEIAPCTWDEAPCPFAKLASMTSPAITLAPNKDKVFKNAADRLKSVIKAVV